MSYNTSSPSVWFSGTAQPSSIQANGIYIWEETTFLQLGVAVALPGTPTPTHVLVKLNSEEAGYPDAGLYTQVIKHIVTAYKTQTLEIHNTTTANETLTAIPTSTVTVSTAKAAAIYIRYQFNVNSDDQCVVTLVVTDMHGFVIARNETPVINKFSTTATVITDNSDVVIIPIVTTPVTQQGDFTSSTLISIGTANLSTYKPLPMFWYGNLGSGLPSAMDVKQLSVWYDSSNKLTFALALPLDELLTKPTSPFKRGVVSDYTGQMCSDKWWFLVDLNAGIAANKETSFLNKMLTAANNGLLFITSPIGVSLTDSPPSTYHAVSNSITVNFALRHGNRTSSSIGSYYDQLLYVSIVDDTGVLLGTASARVRVGCTAGSALFPSDGLFLSSFGLDCRLASCGNTYQTGRIISNGPGTGINVLQGRGGLPTGTEMSSGASATIWDLTKFNVSNYNSFPTWYNAYGINTTLNNETALPYMGLSRSVHSNHTARAARLGYTHYYYPDTFHPLDVGKISTFGTLIAGSNYSAWVAAQAAVVADDDHLFAVTESLKGKSVFLSIPSYTSSAQTTQAVTKDVYLYLPDSDTYYTTASMTSDNALTLDLSFIRKPTPLLSANYGKPISEYQCRATLTGSTMTYEALSNVACGANLFIGFSGKASDFAYRVSHTLTLPNPLTTNRVYTGVTNYPEYAVPFTCNNPTDIGSGNPTPLAPAFVGRLPPHYRMVWVDWASITATTINMYYWKGEDQYDVSTVYTAVVPGDAIVTVAVPIVAGTDSLVVFDGSVRLTMQLENDSTGNFANVKLYAGDTLVATKLSTFPWIHAGSVMVHAHGDSNIDEVIVGDILIESGVYVPVTSSIDLLHSDYVELQVASISTPITASTYESLDLKPYTIYWETSQKVLYLPVLTKTVNTPTRLAKCLAYSQQATTPAAITELLSVSGPVTSVYMSPTHGLQNVPVGTGFHVFTSNDAMTTDDAIVYHWRKGSAYATTIGPLSASIVPGVTVPTRVSSPSTGLTTNLMTTLAKMSAGDLLYNVEAIESNALIRGVQDGVAYAKLPLVFANESVPRYTVQFTRVSTGTWQVNQTLTSHLAISFFPVRPNYVGSSSSKLVTKPQTKAVRFLFPRDTGTVLVQTGFYRGYGWDPLNVSSYIVDAFPADTVTAISTSGNGQVSDSQGKAIIAITIYNQNGKFGFTVYENKVPKLTGVLPTPYINNGTLAISLQNAGSQSTEVLGDLKLIEGDQVDTEGNQGDIIYCVPTATFDASARLKANVETLVTSIPGNYKYAYVSYTITNNGLSDASVIAYATLNATGENVRIGEYLIAPNTSKVTELVLVNRNEKLIFVTTVSNVDVWVSVVAQL